MNEEKPKSVDLVRVGDTELVLTASTLVSRGLELALQLTTHAAQTQSNRTDWRAVVCVTDERLLKLSCDHLKMHGYHTVIGRDPAELLELCNAQSFDLIVTDTGTGALATAEQIHHEDPTIPAITTMLIDQQVFFHAAPFSISPWNQPLSLLHKKVVPEKLKDLLIVGSHQPEVLVWHVWSETQIDGWSKKILDDFGESARPYLEAVYEEIAKIRREGDRMREVLYWDPETWIHNRGFFEMRIVVELERATRFNGLMSLIIADIDHFGRLNDEFGFVMGSEVLRAVCLIVEHTIRKVDMVCRFTGDALIIIVPETSVDYALRVAEKLRRQVESFEFPGVPRPVTISCGVAAYPIHGTTRDELVGAARAALSLAQSQGRNRAKAAVNNL